jgi:hypothetical protein
MRKLALTLLITLPAYSATTATLLIKGVIAPVLEISVVPETIAVNLPLDQSQTNLKIATVKERSNNQAGYKVTIQSQSNLTLKRTSGNEALPYSLLYNGQTVSNGQQFSYNFTNASESQRDLKISYNSAPNTAPAGEYSDTLTFTIAAN